MARAISLPHYFHKKKHQDTDDIMETLVVSVRENYFTFNGWEADGKGSKNAGTLVDRVNQNFATFREWTS
ncbi:MAG: hypothetical protein ACOY30_13010 [Bacillota bacterium]